MTKPLPPLYRGCRRGQGSLLLGVGSLFNYVGEARVRQELAPVLAKATCK